MIYALSVATDLDQTDRKILDALADDARRSASEVGRIVGLSPPPPSGASTGSSRPASSAATRPSWTTGIWTRTSRRSSSCGSRPEHRSRTSTAAVIHLPEVIESFTLAGDPDALAHVRVRDLDHLKNVVDRIRRGRGKPTVTTTRTMIVLGRTDQLSVD